jgi:hypothetical protein
VELGELSSRPVQRTVRIFMGRGRRGRGRERERGREIRIH